MFRLKPFIYLIVGVLLIGCSSSKPSEVEPNPNPKPEPPVLVNKLNSLSLVIQSNGNKVRLEGVVDAEANRVDIDYKGWIDNIEYLLIDYKATGSLFMDDKEVVAGTTELNLSSGVISFIVKSDEAKSQEYLVHLISPQTSGLPIVKIDVENNIDIANLPKTKEYYPSTIEIADYSNKKNSLIAPGGVRGRGNSTWGYPKKPMRIKFDNKESLFGLGAEKSWVLLANYLDPTLLMNSVAFEMAKRLNLEFTNTDFHVELFYNGDYKGNYQLTEQVQVKKERIQVDKKTGFYVELDSYYDDEFKFRTQHLNLPVLVKYPDVESDSEMMFIQEVFDELELALLDSETIETYDLSKLIDIETFVKFMLVFEVSRNYEVQHPKSIKLYKKSDKDPIQFGPVWDFDWAYGKIEGSNHFRYFHKYRDLAFNPDQRTGKAHKFFNLFFLNKEFKDTYVRIWNEEFKRGTFNLDAFISAKALQLEASQELNFSIWDNGLSYKEQVEQMKEWLIDRVEYINTEVNKF